MSSTITGHCLCGGITFEYDRAVGPANYCHCEDCRRCTGGPFNIGVRLVGTRFRITAGEPKGFTKAGDSGRELTRHFCPDCGSPLFTSAPKHPDLVYVKAGVLDDPSVVQPTHQNWLASTAPWRSIPSDLTGFRHGPSSAPDIRCGGRPRAPAAPASVRDTNPGSLTRRRRQRDCARRRRKGAAVRRAAEGAEVSPRQALAFIRKHGLVLELARSRALPRAA